MVALSTGYEIRGNLVIRRTYTTCEERAHTTSGCVQPIFRLAAESAPAGDFDSTMPRSLTQMRQCSLCIDAYAVSGAGRSWGREVTSRLACRFSDAINRWSELGC